MDRTLLQQAKEAARNFCLEHAGLDICEIGAGNINDTFLVTPKNQEAFILQRLSRQAFSAPELICENLSILSRHLTAERITHLVPERRWDMPTLLPTTSGASWWCDDTGNFWRALSYIADTVTLTSLQSQDQGLEVGRALASFHTLVENIEQKSLHITIPHFHETPHYFALYKEALAANPSGAESPLAKECCTFIEQHRHHLFTLEEARSQGELKVTTIHGDPKLANILFDQESMQACALIDLDTVGPGLLLYDLGDCLRSCCYQIGSEDDLDTIRFDIDLCLAIITGYLSVGPHLLGPGEQKHLLAAIRLIPFELGLRFFSDYLQGCRYFKTTSPDHTLWRAAAQFRLVASIEKQHNHLAGQVAQLFVTN